MNKIEKLNNTVERAKRAYMRLTPNSTRGQRNRAWKAYLRACNAMSKVQHEKA